MQLFNNVHFFESKYSRTECKLNNCLSAGLKLTLQTKRRQNGSSDEAAKKSRKEDGSADDEEEDGDSSNNNSRTGVRNILYYRL